MQNAWYGFVGKPPEPKPVLRPLRYCDFRVAESHCPVFASGEVDKMSFCDQHQKVIEEGLQDGGK